MPGLADLYREVVLDHYRNPRGRGTLETPPASKAEGYNPYCGDEVTVYTQVGDDGALTMRWEGVGCSISQASASMMARAIQTKSELEARQVMEAFREMLDLHRDRLNSDTDDMRGGAGPSADSNAERNLGDLQALEGVVKLPVRLKCALLPWSTLDDALAAAN